MITSFLCQKVSKQTSKLKTKQLQTIYDNIILVSGSLQTDIEIQKTKELQTVYDNIILVSESLKTDIKIENKAITDHLW